MPMRIKITIEVDYDEATVTSEERLVLALEREVDRAIQEGLLTPSGEEVVDGFTAIVE